MHDLDFFIDEVENQIGTNPLFQNWEDAYKHYFGGNKVLVVSQTTSTFRALFAQAFKTDIVDKFYDCNVVSRFGLPDVFKNERRLLLAIGKRHRDIFYQLSRTLIEDASFWHEAITVNTGAVSVLSDYEIHRNSVVLNASYNQIVADEALMLLVINQDKPCYKSGHNFFRSMGPLLQYPTNPVAIAAAKKNPEYFFYAKNNHTFDQQRACLKNELSKYIDARTTNLDSYFHGAAISTFFGGYSRKEKLDAATALSNYLADPSIVIDPKHFPMLKQGRLGAAVSDWGRYFKNDLAFIQDKPAAGNNMQA